MIKVFVLTISPLHEALAEAESELLGQIRTYCRPNLTQPVIELIRETINEDVTFTKLPIDMWHQRTYAVKVSILHIAFRHSLIVLQSGVNGLLDVARQTYKEGTDDVHQHVDDINSKHHASAATRPANSAYRRVSNPPGDQVRSRSEVLAKNAGVRFGRSSIA